MNDLVWKTVTLEDDVIASHRIGPLSIYLKKVFNDIWVAAERDESGNHDPLPVPENPDWMRTALPKAYHEYTFTPVFPDRPVVVNTEYSYRIYPGGNARVYCRVPVFVRISPVDKPDLVIAELPTLILSGTWFGIFTEGEHSYALSSTLRRVITSDLHEPHLVICPMVIHNTSESDLKFEKVCLRSERLSIYEKDGVMWADETKITHHSGEAHSDIEMKGVLPPEAEGGKLLSGPRLNVKKSLAVRTFKLLRDFGIAGH
ncbi:hypothetical protein QA596_11130 [Balneolales bacterium ANBcel1]|nr:hypothetical protein [Balneolales bacterium ANBcel1]